MRGMTELRTLTMSCLALVLAACAGGDAGYPESDLSVTVEHPDFETATYDISCTGDAATIDGIDLDAEAACTALSEPAVQSRLIDGPPADQVCTEIYGGPDTATIAGTLDGETVTTQVDRTNGCGIADWDELLADILPAARGVTE
jgi:hypothetical protein